ncbi:MAG: HNH endonuclease [Mesorhizobium amorphae]|nr:MAG: HNH endonuclease [Mesorhizobium amorphae]
MTTPFLPDPNGGRSIPEWIGKTPDAKVPDIVRTRVFLRAGGICHISGRKIHDGEAWDVEHVQPLSMGGEHRENNFRPALRDKHREKTAVEAGDRAKADRIRRKRLGTWPKSRARIPNRPFSSSRPHPKEAQDGR